MSVPTPLYCPLIKKGATWYVEYHTPAGRKRAAKTNTGVALNSIADLAEREKAAKQFVEYLQSTFPKVDTLATKPSTLLGILNFIIDVNRQWTPGTVHSYRSIVRLFGKFLEKQKRTHISPTSFSAELCREYFDHLLIVEKYSNTTYNNHRRTLGLLFRAAQKRGLIKNNVIEQIEYLRKVDTTRRPFRAEEDLVIMSRIWDNPQLRFAYIALRYLSIRPNEIRFVRCGQFDFKRGLLTLPSSSAKNKMSSTITIPEGIIPHLLELGIQTKSGHNYVLCKATESNYAKREIGTTTNQIGENYLSECFRKIIKKLQKEGKIQETKDLCFYSLKYTLTADMISQGIDIKTTMDHLRLNDVASFQRYLKRTGMILPAVQKMQVVTPGDVSHNSQ